MLNEHSYSSKQESSLLIAPNLIIHGVQIKNIPVDKIRGFNLIKKYHGFKPLSFPQPPVVFSEDDDFFELVLDEKIWLPDVNNNETFSHISCVVIPHDIEPQRKYEIFITLRFIHSNRALKKASNIYTEINESPAIRQAIRNSYQTKSKTIHTSKLTLANSISSRHEKRILKKAQQKLKKQTHKKIWSNFARATSGVMTLDEICNILPNFTPENVKNRVFALMEKHPEDLPLIWNIISDGLINWVSHND